MQESFILSKGIETWAKSQQHKKGHNVYIKADKLKAVVFATAAEIRNFGQSPCCRVEQEDVAKIMQPPFIRRAKTWNMWKIFSHRTTTLLVLESHWKRRPGTDSLCVQLFTTNFKILFVSPKENLLWKYHAILQYFHRLFSSLAFKNPFRNTTKNLHRINYHNRRYYKCRTLYI